MKKMICCWIAPAAFVLDRLSKAWAQRVLMEGQPVYLLGLLRLVYVENRGAAFGIFSGASAFLLIATAIVLALLLFFAIRMWKTLPLLAHAALWLLLGGAMGNFFDRLVYGYVIDFIEITAFSFPVFNVADCCVVGAFILLMAHVLFSKEAAEDAG